MHINTVQLVFRYYFTTSPALKSLPFTAQFATIAIYPVCQKGTPALFKQVHPEKANEADGMIPIKAGAGESNRDLKKQ